MKFPSVKNRKKSYGCCKHAEVVSAAFVQFSWKGCSQIFAKTE